MLTGPILARLFRIWFGSFGPIKAKIDPVSTLKLTLFIAVKSSNSGKILTKLEIIIYSNNLYWILK
jgi:hypothetical protein